MQNHVEIEHKCEKMWNHALIIATRIENFHHENISMWSQSASLFFPFIRYDPSFIILYFHHTLLSLKKMQIYDLFVKTRLFKDNTNDFIVKTYYNILTYYQPVLTLTSSLHLQPIGLTYHSVLTLSSNPHLHPICPTYHSVLTLTSNPRLQPISPTYLRMMSHP